MRDEEGVAVYCDPPYLSKSDRYKHDFDDDDSLFVSHHRRLADILSRFKRARVVVSYYKHPNLPMLYPPKEWEWRTIEVRKKLSNLSNQGNGKRKDAGTAVEVLLCRN